MEWSSVVVLMMPKLICLKPAAMRRAREFVWISRVANGQIHFARKDSLVITLLRRGNAKRTRGVIGSSELVEKLCLTNSAKCYRKSHAGRKAAFGMEISKTAGENGMNLMLAKGRFLPATMRAQSKIASPSKGVAGRKIFARKLCPAINALSITRRSLRAKRKGVYSRKRLKFV